MCDRTPLWVAKWQGWLLGASKALWAVKNSCMVAPVVVTGLGPEWV